MACARARDNHWEVVLHGVVGGGLVVDLVLLVGAALHEQLDQIAASAERRVQERSDRGAIFLVHVCALGQQQLDDLVVGCACATGADSLDKSALSFLVLRVHFHSRGKLLTEGHDVAILGRLEKCGLIFLDIIVTTALFLQVVRDFLRLLGKLL